MYAYMAVGWVSSLSRQLEKVPAVRIVWKESSIQEIKAKMHNSHNVS